MSALPAPVPPDDALALRPDLGYLWRWEQFAGRARVLHAPDAYWLTDTNLPVPPALAGYVRGSAGYSRCLQYVLARWPAWHERTDNDLLAMELIARLNQDPTSPAIAAILLALVPRRRCQHCGREYLAVSRRLHHCSERCRRANAR